MLMAARQAILKVNLGGIDSSELGGNSPFLDRYRQASTGGFNLNDQPLAELGRPVTTGLFARTTGSL